MSLCSPVFIEINWQKIGASRPLRARDELITNCAHALLWSAGLRLLSVEQTRLEVGEGRAVDATSLLQRLGTHQRLHGVDCQARLLRRARVDPN